MTDHQFTLVLQGNLNHDQTLDALFEAGCNDATFGTVDQVGYAEFVREASSFGEAVRSAIEDVESVPGIKVQRIEPDDLVTMAEIAERLGRSRESVRLLIQGARGPGGFPAPVSHLRAKSRLWRWSEVALWAAESTSPVDSHAAAVIAALNAALTLRTSSMHLTPGERSLLATLI